MNALEQIKALPAKWRAIAAEQDKIAENTGLTEAERDWHLARSQQAEDDADDLDAALQSLRDEAGEAITPTMLADALEVFWNASLGATHPHNDPTANAVMAGMVEGFAAMAGRLREYTRPAPAANADPHGGVFEGLLKLADDMMIESCGDDPDYAVWGPVTGVHMHTFVSRLRRLAAGALPQDPVTNSPLTNAAQRVASFLDHANLDWSHLPPGMGSALRVLRDTLNTTQPSDVDAGQPVFASFNKGRLTVDINRFLKTPEAKAMVKRVCETAPTPPAVDVNTVREVVERHISKTNRVAKYITDDLIAALGGKK